MNIPWLTFRQIYDAFSAPALASTLRDLFSRYKGTRCLLSAAVRNEATFKRFEHECGKVQQKLLSSRRPRNILTKLALHEFHIQYLDTFSHCDPIQIGLFYLTTIPVIGLLIMEGATAHEAS